MTEEMLSFLTPYWSGREMMRIHLASIRQFYPTAPILVSKKGGDLEEMEAHRAEFGIRYWLEDCTYVDALLRLLGRCETEYVCITDHDAILLSSPDHLLSGLVQGHWDLVGTEELVRETPDTDWMRLAPIYNGWMRFAPGYMDATFLMFNLREFLRRWGLRGIRGERKPGRWANEYHYGICEKLKRHKYLLPYHTRKYGLGNLLKDGNTAVLWHQWYGSYQKRLAGLEHEAFEPGASERITILRRAENAFLQDYPNLDLADLTPAWGPDCDTDAERVAAARGNPTGFRGFIRRDLPRIRRWPRHGVRGLAARVLARLDRWRRLL